MEEFPLSGLASEKGSGRFLPFWLSVAAKRLLGRASHGLRNELQQIEIRHEGGLDRAPGLSRQSYVRARARPAVSTMDGVRKPF